MPSARNLPERLATHSPMCTARRTDWANAMIARKSNPSAMPSLTGGEMRATLETGSILANSATAQQWRSRLYMMMRTQGYQHEQPLGPKAWAAGAEQGQQGQLALIQFCSVGQDLDQRRGQGRSGCRQD